MGASRRSALAFAVTIVLVVPLAVFGGSSFAKGMAAAAQYEYGPGGSQYQYPGKQTVCLKTGSAKNPHVTITVSAKAASKLIASGKATAGACPRSTGKPGNQMPGNDGTGNHGKSNGNAGAQPPGNDGTGNHGNGNGKGRHP
jgi:hypothetical protein